MGLNDETFVAAAHQYQYVFILVFIGVCDCVCVCVRARVRVCVARKACAEMCIAPGRSVAAPAASGPQLQFTCMTAALSASGALARSQAGMDVFEGYQPDSWSAVRVYWLFVDGASSYCGKEDVMQCIVHVARACCAG